MTERTPIPDVLPDLPEREAHEIPPAVRFVPGLPTQTFVVGRDDGDVSTIVEDCEALVAAGWLEAFVVRPREDGQGSYVHVCCSREQAIGLLQANAWHKLAERVAVRAFVADDFPIWARAQSGGPAHVFYGVPVPEQ